MELEINTIFFVVVVVYLLVCAPITEMMLAQLEERGFFKFQLSAAGKAQCIFFLQALHK